MSNNTISKAQLAALIKSVVRECINERKDKWIQGAIDQSHKGYCTPMTKSTCTPHRKAFAMRAKHHDLQECDMQEVAPPGFGAAYATMWKLHKKLEEASYKVAPDTLAKTEKDNQALTVQTDPKMNEASYKVVSKTQATDAKEDKALKVQTEPKVNETAFKKQGPSAKTFKDSPQFPDAVNDPENA